jgi:hypothetical protein
MNDSNDFVDITPITYPNKALWFLDRASRYMCVMKPTKPVHVIFVVGRVALGQGVCQVHM